MQELAALIVSENCAMLVRKIDLQCYYVTRQRVSYKY